MSQLYNCKFLWQKLNTNLQFFDNSDEIWQVYNYVESNNDVYTSQSV